MTTQRSALVTGGASGIGLAIARGLAARGHRVLLADVSESVHAAARDLSTDTPDGMTVSCVAPGRIATPLSSLSRPEILAAAAKAIPVGRLATTDQCPSAVMFLASEEVSRSTGA